MGRNNGSPLNILLLFFSLTLTKKFSNNSHYYLKRIVESMNFLIYFERHILLHLFSLLIVHVFDILLLL
jgi:hypothetical protein